MIIGLKVAKGFRLTLGTPATGKPGYGNAACCRFGDSSTQAGSTPFATQLDREASTLILSSTLLCLEYGTVLQGATATARSILMDFWGQRRELPRYGPETAAKAPSTVERSPGLNIVYNNPEAKIDIVAVHGLNGHWKETWTATNYFHWLYHFLPEDLPGIRVLSWGYNANTRSPGNINCRYLYDSGVELVGSLARKRRTSRSFERPIVFVAHSVGGLVVRSALVYSESQRCGVSPSHRSVKVSTYGIFYMGTPHQDDGVQIRPFLANVASIFTPADYRILKTLEKDSKWLERKLGQYNRISSEFVTRYAYETNPTSTVLGNKIFVVPRGSTVVPGQMDAKPIDIHADHINMVKFECETDRGYVEVSEALQTMAMNANEAIRLRWNIAAGVNDGENLNGKEPVLPPNTPHYPDNWRPVDNWHFPDKGTF
ncbi:hypothetical protein O1611_g2223 [Lasiodiplodia mahajangana]|uniref:Uncharacterized protein n=1 Tax=Lasiodiplodia mahajangana TaxID=1108764 RepID=A0ACC2JV60_9PEZI|nr:hypothetical protein O1611_g2223 [Lasiodiplodia mahajangana]